MSQRQKMFAILENVNCSQNEEEKKNTRGIGSVCSKLTYIGYFNLKIYIFKAFSVTDIDDIQVLLYHCQENK